MTDEAPLDLRARRHLETKAEIHRAAMALFEENGLKETTVQQIADRAGVSPRTFFRYFTSKEQAALPGQGRLLQAIDTLQLTDADPAAILRSVEDATATVMGRDNDPELDEHRRIAKLLVEEPELRALAAAQERVLTTRLRARIGELQPDIGPITALLISEVAVATWRTSWERWGELALAGKPADPAALYRQCCEELRRTAR